MIVKEYKLEDEKLVFVKEELGISVEHFESGKTHFSGEGSSVYKLFEDDKEVDTFTSEKSGVF